MALIKTIDEVRKYVDNVEKDSMLDKLKPKFTMVEDTVVIPHIGREFYVEIEAAYQAATLTAAQQLVVDYLQEIVANLSVALAMDTLQVTIGATGVNREESGASKTAYRYQADSAKRQLNLTGWKVLENLLAFLERSTGTYPTWEGSSAYTVNKSLVINSADVFDGYYPIAGSRLMFNALKHQIKLVEDMELKGIIGRDLLTEIKTEIAAANVSADNQTLLDDFIYAAVANLSIARAISDSVATLDENGVVVYERIANSTTDAEVRSSAMDRVTQKRFAAQNNGMAYLDELRSYLDANASDTKYAAYYSSDKYTAPLTDSDDDVELSTYVAG